jgi:2-keto-4-pentenoate hydratase/2-oxohepta-3-ene-1,7-dioic acid hydratase in catechol pathway
MQIVRFLSLDGPRIGLIVGDAVLDLVLAAHECGWSWIAPLFSELRLFLAAGEEGRELARQLQSRSRMAHRSLAESKLLAPFEAGSRVFAHVVNYKGHDRDAGVKIPVKPFFFIKNSGCIANPDDPILAHAWSRKLDHEVELGVVVSKVGANIPADRAYEHVGGYCVVNDVSYRDLQASEGFPELRTHYGMNWPHGKGMDFACPMGPLVVLSDEMRVPYPLAMTCTVNGVVRQAANTEEMVFKVPALIEELSKGITLMPGDVIATGTCSGGGLSDGVFLKPGDCVECEIERIGKLRNKVAAMT